MTYDKDVIIHNMYITFFIFNLISDIGTVNWNLLV